LAFLKNTTIEKLSTLRKQLTELGYKLEISWD